MEPEDEQQKTPLVTTTNKISRHPALGNMVNITSIKHLYHIVQGTPNINSVGILIERLTLLHPIKGSQCVKITSQEFRGNFTTRVLFMHVVKSLVALSCMYDAWHYDITV